MMTPSPHLIARVERLMGARSVVWTPVQGGYTPAGRWIVRFHNGASAFAKVGTTVDTASWLRAEYRFYSQVIADYLPALLGWADGDEPILLLEDLSGAFWPPPWSHERVEQVLTTLAAVAATSPPPDLPALALSRDRLASWTHVADDPKPFLSLNLCSSSWLETSLPAFLAADAAAILDGDSLVHLDVRSDNLCFVGDRVVLVDWNLACIIHKGIGQQDRRHFSPLFEPGFGRLRCGARRGVPLP